MGLHISFNFKVQPFQTIPYHMVLLKIQKSMEGNTLDIDNIED